MDNISVWEKALSSAEIANYMNNHPTGTENGLVGLWKCNTGSGNTLFDETSENNNGTIHGALWYSSSGGNNDSDGDGVNNDEDDYPSDPNRAYNNYFPASSYGSLAFEDLWPGRGDYDFNDLVVDYQFKTVTNASNFVKEIKAYFVVKAIGASLKNGFGFQFPNDNISFSDISVSGTQLDVGYVSTNSNGLESGQDLNTIIVFEML